MIAATLAFQSIETAFGGDESSFVGFISTGWEVSARADT
jgi:hypothetical protein